MMERSMRCVHDFSEIHLFVSFRTRCCLAVSMFGQAGDVSGFSLVGVDSDRDTSSPEYFIDGI